MVVTVTTIWVKACPEHDKSEKLRNRGSLLHVCFNFRSEFSVIWVVRSPPYKFRCSFCSVYCFTFYNSVTKFGWDLLQCTEWGILFHFLHRYGCVCFLAQILLFCPIKRNNCISVAYHNSYENECVVNFHGHGPLPGSVENFHLSVSISHLLGTGAVLVPDH